jgi:fibronectin type 3 domain-containing protein
MRPFSKRLAVFALIFVIVTQTYATVPTIKGVGSAASDALSTLRAKLQSLQDALSAALRNLSHGSDLPASTPTAVNAPSSGPQFIQNISLAPSNGINPGLRHLAFDPSNGYLYVVGSDGNVTVLNPTTNSIIANITLGISFPDSDAYIAFNPINRYLYVTEGGGAGWIGVINGTSNTLVTTLRADPVNFTYPQGIITDPTNGNVYVALAGGGSATRGVAVYNSTTNSFSKLIRLPPICSTRPLCSDSRAQDLAYDTANGYIYVTGDCADDNNTNSCIYVIDHSTNTVLTNFLIPRPCCTYDIAYDTSKNSLYITGGHNAVYYADPTTNTFTGAIAPSATGATPDPAGMTFDPANSFLYVAGSSCGSPPDFLCSIFVISDSSNSLAATIPLEHGANPFGVLFDPNNSKIYATANRLPFVYVIPGVSAQAPSPPLRLQATTTANNVTLTWNPPASSGGSAISGYNVYRSTSQGDEALIASGVTGLSYIDTVSVPASQIFYYYVTAVNSYGEGYPSNEINITVNPDFGINATPTSLNGSPGNNSTSSTIILTSFNGFTSPVSLSVVFATTVSGVIASFTPSTVTPSGISTLTFNLNSTAQAGSFSFYVQGIGGGLTRNSQTLSLTIMGMANTPTAPQYLRATGGVGYVNLTWSPPSSNGGTPVTNYKIYRGIMSGGESLVATIGNQLTWIDNTVDEGATYYYRVSAVNYAGEGPQSNEASAVTTEPPTPTLVVSITGQGNVTDGFGETYTATAYSDGNPVPNATIAWSVNPAVGTPTSGTSSKFSWFAPDTGSGTVTITATATANGYQQGSSSLLVSFAPPPSIISFVKISPAGASILFPGSQAYAATCYDEYGLAIAGCAVSWSLSPASFGQFSTSAGNSTTFTANRPSAPPGVPQYGVITVTGLYNSNIRIGTASLSVTIPVTYGFVTSTKLSTDSPEFNTPYTINVSITNTGNIPQYFTVGVNQTSTSPSGSFGLSIPVPSFFTCDFGFASRAVNALLNGNAIPSGTQTQTVLLNPGQTATLPFTIRDSWDWIQPWNVGQLICSLVGGILTDKLFKVLAVANDVKNAINALNSWGLAFPFLNYHTQVSVNGNLQPPSSTFVFVPPWKILFFIDSILLGLLVSTEATLTGISTCFIPPFVGCAGLVAEVLVITAQQATYIVAQDPTTNYNKVFVPRPVTLLNGTRFTSLPFVNSLPANLRTFVSNLAYYVEFQNATVTSMNRYGSAIAAGDNRSALVQLRAAQAYAIIKDLFWANVTNTLSSGVLPIDPIVDSTAVLAAQSYVSTNGLPSLERELLTGLGLGSQIPSITKSLLEYNYTYIRTTSLTVDSKRIQRYNQLELSTLLNITVKQPPHPHDNEAMFKSSAATQAPMSPIAIVGFIALLQFIPLVVLTPRRKRPHSNRQVRQSFRAGTTERD